MFKKRQRNSTFLALCFAYANPWFDVGLVNMDPLTYSKSLPIGGLSFPVSSCTFCACCFSTLDASQTRRQLLTSAVVAVNMFIQSFLWNSMHLCIYTSLCMHGWMCTYVFVCLYTYIYVSMSLPMHPYVVMDTCMLYACLDVCMHVCMYDKIMNM